MKKEKQEQIWKASYAVLCAYLKLFRTEGWKVTSFKSWDMIKWNAVGHKVFLSELALECYLANDSIEKNTKAASFDNENGPKNSRCFVAEHIFPTRVLQDFTYQQFADQDPSIEEFQAVFMALNCLCYVWFEEDIALQSSGLKSSLNSGAEEICYDDYYTLGLDATEAARGLKKLLMHRYENCSPPIRIIETRFSDGQGLFRYLRNARSLNMPLSKIVSEIKA